MRCGVGDYTRALAEHFAQRSHHVTVVTSKLPNIDTSSPTVKVLAILPDWEWREFFRNYRHFILEWPRAIIVQYPSLMPGRRAELTFWLPILCRLFIPFGRVLLIVHEFSRTHESAKQELGKAFRFAHEILVVNSADEPEILLRFPKVRQKLRFLPTGSTIPFRPAVPEHLQLLRDSAEAPDRGLLFFFGFVQSQEKGFDDLLEALAMLADIDVILVASGDLDSGNPHHEQIQRRIAALELHRRVRWIGHLSPDDASHWLQAADLVVLPFRTGATANRTSLIAALVNRTAVVTTAGPDTPDFLRDRENVLLTKPKDPTGLARTIRQALSSPEMLNGIRRGTESLAPRFDWIRITDLLLDRSRSHP